MTILPQEALPCELAPAARDGTEDNVRTVNRVGRDLSRFGKDRSERAREELIAELGSCFLCADLGIVPELEPRADHAAYLQSWLSVLANDKRAIFQAAAHAQRAVAFLQQLQNVEANQRKAASYL